jgi:hypothetical protein
MAKKGLVASAVRAAVTAAEKALAPSPLAKRVIAAAAAEAIRHVEERAPEVLAPVEKALRKNAGQLAKPIDKALAAETPRKRGSRKPARGNGRGRKAVASRKTEKSARARAGAARKKPAKTSGRKKAGRAKRR